MTLTGTGAKREKRNFTRITRLSFFLLATKRNQPNMVHRNHTTESTFAGDTLNGIPKISPSLVNTPVFIGGNP